MLLEFFLIHEFRCLISLEVDHKIHLGSMIEVMSDDYYKLILASVKDYSFHDFLGGLSIKRAKSAVYKDELSVLSIDRPGK